MKKPLIFVLPLMLFFLMACEKEDVIPQVEKNFIANVTLPEFSSGKEDEIEVTIHKANPCQVVKEVVLNVSGNVNNYDFILGSSEDPCSQMVAEEMVTVNFDPSELGQYTLNFLINGEVFETRMITVSE